MKRMQEKSLRQRSFIESSLFPYHSPPIIPVRFKGPRGTKEVDALIDTGASYVILSWKDALHLGYNPKLSLATVQF